MNDINEASVSIASNISIAQNIWNGIKAMAQSFYAFSNGLALLSFAHG